ncbi:MAG: 1-deoxy-D-xylulose 5-phosphate reductoisomerase (EC [uncultured Thiotrichaceae bacterium]|uniref:1-deoxy-D-xylulose 5-phosphate reductoisomerase n=1 Tax=uncultured Thiotrichaceae bacterium TaxID=298394 RepID=A0A6S6SQE8_9GAMM|nr:MAG: 1-deoxy-D-xylulose 5-phosphate reductoisomerase (EC [uncultured Thiotrichaceae bacterium]
MTIQAKQLTILGATGSIGVSTLDVVSRHPEKYSVFALSANLNVEKMLEQCLQFKPRYAVMADNDAAEELENGLVGTVASDTQVLAGKNALSMIASHDEVDYVMAAIVGAAGLLPTLAAAESGKRVLLANKESLVMSGKIFMDAIRENAAELLPIDSEHNAIFQSMPHPQHSNNDKAGVEKILLTGSGGPFRTRDISTLQAVTPEEAVAHPNWSMGRKISVDSATMMNKGLEVIEACWLFDVADDKVQVVVHPQSTIHSMVSYNDGSVLAQLGRPDMRTPIAYSLAWPERIESGVEPLDFFEASRFDFEPPNFERFPCLRLAYEAHREGGYASIALNAANEVAVAAFLDHQIPFTDIPHMIEDVMADAASGTPFIVDDILIQDKASRVLAESWIKNKNN